MLDPRDERVTMALQDVRDLDPAALAAILAEYDADVAAAVRAALQEAELAFEATLHLVADELTHALLQQPPAIADLVRHKRAAVRSTWEATNAAESIVANEQTTHGAPPRIGRYRDVRFFKQGGMGALYRAFDPELKRDVVLKTLPAALDDDREAQMRLRREARLAGQFEHPGLCRVLDVIETDQRLYVVLPFLEGDTLEEHLAHARASGDAPHTLWLALTTSLSSKGTIDSQESRGRPDVRGLPGVLWLFERLARAMHAAHTAGVIHRDLKPSNVMIRPDGSPVIIDFGIAVRPDERTQRTEMGRLLGSFPYMSAEQASGDPALVDRRTDVYALGVVLYEVLTLERPYSGLTVEALLAAIQGGDPKRPRNLNPRVSREVEAVCLMAMALEPKRRYQTALEFADDLKNLRELCPIRATTTSTVGLLWRRVRRNPAAASFAAVAVILLGGVIGLAVVTTQRAAARTELIDAVRDVRSAHLLGKTPPTKALAILEAVVQDKDLRASLVNNPLHPDAFDRLIDFMSDNLRGSDEDAGMQLLAPRAANADPRPVLRFRSGLKNDRAWHFIVRLESLRSDVAFEERAVQHAGGGDVVAIQPGIDHALAAGGWRWTVSLDSERHPSAGKSAAMAEFTVIAPSALEELRASLPRTGDEVLDRHLEATALLRLGLASMALARLEHGAGMIEDPADHARQLLLEGQARALLGDRESLEAARERWQPIARRHAVEGTERSR